MFTELKCTLYLINVSVCIYEYSAGSPQYDDMFSVCEGPWCVSAGRDVCVHTFALLQMLIL